MIHQYKNNGYNIVLDVCSGSVHVVDDLVYDVIALYEEMDPDEIVKRLPQYPENEIREAYDEITELKDQGQLLQKMFTRMQSSILKNVRRLSRHYAFI